jgi:hypothetical protein
MNGHWHGFWLMKHDGWWEMNTVNITLWTEWRITLIYCHKTTKGSDSSDTITIILNTTK